MGTSAGADPVTGNHPLIPSWIADDYPVDTPDQIDDPTAVQQNGAATLGRRFSNARRTMSSAVRLISTGDGGGGRDRGRATTPAGKVRKAVGQYVSSRGGPAGVADRLSVAVGVGARLYDVLERIAREGLDTALQGLGITVDEDSLGAVADALMTLVCEDVAGQIEGVLDENLARCACDETFIELYQQGIMLSQLTADNIPFVLRAFAANAACLLITREIGTMIVDRPRTEEESRTLQTTLKSVVEMSMRIQLPNRSGTTNYTVGQIRTAIRTAYLDAFRILQAGR